MQESPRGGAAGRRLVFLHGFTQNAACIGDIGPGLAKNNELLAVDLPGHAGSSDYASADLWQSASLIAKTTGPACYIGYSMGGRIALHLALTDPTAVDRLVLIGATAGISDPATRAERALLDAKNADRIVELGTNRFVEEWLKQPLFATLPSNTRFEEERGRNNPSALAQSLRKCGTGSMEPLWERLDAIECPVLILSGSEDAKFRELAERMAHAIGRNATAVVIAGSGHSVHLEQPALCREAIERFLG
ncbi:MAG TPA: alpha/beta fold hydrolase [Microthrixaceae bacterium]|nr:alpha/beta fold hydrolase [Microthrixaceae bacterium]